MKEHCELSIKDNNSSFAQVLEKGSSVIHHRNLQVLVIEIYKTLNNLSSPLFLIQAKKNKIQFS